MQQHSNPSHSIQKDFVPPAPPSGFTMEEMVEEAAEPGPLRFTRVEEVEVHILAGRCCLIEVDEAVGLVFLGIDYVGEALIMLVLIFNSLSI